MPPKMTPIPASRSSVIAANAGFTCWRSSRLRLVLGQRSFRRLQIGMDRPMRQLEVERTLRLHLFPHESDALLRDVHDPLRVVFHMERPTGNGH